jgi:hypothetical protein
VQAEKLETVSTFAEGIAHQVKNPLQTILLGVDFLRVELAQCGPGAEMALSEIENAARKADAVIRALLEFSSNGKQDVGDHDLNPIIEDALAAVAGEMAVQSVGLVKSLAPCLPPLSLDARKIKHVFMKLFLGLIRTVPAGAALRVRTRFERSPASAGVPSTPEGGIVVAEVQCDLPQTPALPKAEQPQSQSGTKPVRENDLDSIMIGKIVELFGGSVRSVIQDQGLWLTTITFKARAGTASR